jgi:hypothetical protein
MAAFNDWLATKNEAWFGLGKKTTPLTMLDDKEYAQAEAIVNQITKNFGALKQLLAHKQGWVDAINPISTQAYKLWDLIGTDRPVSPEIAARMSTNPSRVGEFYNKSGLNPFAQNR